MKSGRGGVQYEDVKVREGPRARGDEVQADQAVSFRIGERNVIAGLEYGVEGMREGGERRVRVGPHLAYREDGIPGIVPANAVLEFHVTLLRVETSA